MAWGTFKHTTILKNTFQLDAIISHQKEVNLNFIIEILKKTVLYLLYLDLLARLIKAALLLNTVRERLADGFNDKNPVKLNEPYKIIGPYLKKRPLLEELPCKLLGPRWKKAFPRTAHERLGGFKYKFRLNFIQELPYKLITAEKKSLKT